MISDKMFLITKIETTENIPSLIMRWLIIFNHCTFLDLGFPIDGGLISTIDLTTKFNLATKFGLA
jgi:hypothetical protein